MPRDAIQSIVPFMGLNQVPVPENVPVFKATSPTTRSAISSLQVDLIYASTLVQKEISLYMMMFNGCPG